MLKQTRKLLSCPLLSLPSSDGRPWRIRKNGRGRQAVMAPHAGCGLHMRRDIRGDLSSEDHGEDERAIFHDRNHREIIVWFHHLLIPFLLKLGIGAREAAINGNR